VVGVGTVGAGITGEVIAKAPLGLATELRSLGPPVR
jgi:hypothetical protein